MINGCEINVAFPGDASKALPLIATELKKLGYALKSQQSDELHMVFAGKWITADPNKLKHSLKVTPAGGQLSFRFGTGLIASVWTQSDLEWAQARTDEVVAAAALQQPAPS